jgi:DNA-binding response OmpR family regulator
MENTVKILIADDDDDFREMLCGFLSGEGYSVVEASDGADVFDKVLMEMPDVVLLDVMLPSRNGFDICRDIKTDKRTKKSNVIMLTVKDGLPDKLSGYVAGAQRYLCKPCALEDIGECLKAVLRQRRLTHIQFEQDLRH